MLKLNSVSTKSFFRNLLVPITLSAALLAGTALAQAVDFDKVLATVNGQSITEADLSFAAEDLAADLQSIPAAERRAFLLTVMIDMKVMAQAARTEGLGDNDMFKRRLAYLEDRTLRRSFFSDVIEADVTQEKMQTLYDEVIADFEPSTEVHARHILVATEEEAKTILAEIEAGKSFEDAAAEYSLDGSKASGGDLGFFGKGMMVPPFEEAAYALKTGETSAPVESQFGWHIIKVEETRESTAPTLEQLLPQLAQQVLFNNFEEKVGALKEATEVDIKDADLKAQIDAAVATETPAP